MQKLKDLIHQSRDWAAVDRLRTLSGLVQGVLQNTFEVDSGMFMYLRTPNTVRIYQPWGLPYSESELTELVSSTEWFRDGTYVPHERWIPVTECPPTLMQFWMQEGVQFVGSWPLNVKKQRVGVFVLGRKTAPTADDDDLMSICAAHVSLVFEMLTLRRMAERLSHHDPLTNILNRRGFMEQFSQLSQVSDQPLIIGILDVDHFKAINDTDGHVRGDCALSEVAQTLRDNLGERGICGRMGGDEFVFALQAESLTVSSATSDVASWFHGKNYTVSVGCASYGIDGTDWDSCYHLADQRLYEQRRAVR